MPVQFQLVIRHQRDFNWKGIEYDIIALHAEGIYIGDKHADTFVRGSWNLKLLDNYAIL